MHSLLPLFAFKAGTEAVFWANECQRKDLMIAQNPWSSPGTHILGHPSFPVHRGTSPLNSPLRTAIWGLRVECFEQCSPNIPHHPFLQSWPLWAAADCNSMAVCHCRLLVLILVLLGGWRKETEGKKRGCAMWSIHPSISLMKGVQQVPLWHLGILIGPWGPIYINKARWPRQFSSAALPRLCLEMTYLPGPSPTWFLPCDWQRCWLPPKAVYGAVSPLSARWPSLCCSPGGTGQQAEQ